MADFWHAIDLDLDEQIEVQQIMEATDAPIDVVIGRLVRFWLWIKKSTADAVMPGISTKTLCRKFGGDDAFWQAVAASGWLILRNDGIEIPGYEKRFGDGVKKRLLANRRQANYRQNKAEGERVTHPSRDRNASVTQERDACVTKASPIKIKREIKKEENSNTSPDSGESAGVDRQPMVTGSAGVDRQPKLTFSPEDEATAAWMATSIREIFPRTKPPNIPHWANEIRLLRERDQRTDGEIRDLFGWANRNDFWRGNILSPANLRKHWDKLMAQRARGDPASRDVTAKLHGSGARYEPGRNTNWE